jgi:hypothetical protein
MPEEIKQKIRDSGLLDKMEEATRKAGGTASGADLLQLQVGRLRAALPSRNREVLEARVPWNELRRRKGIGAELHGGPMTNQRAILKNLDPRLESIPAMNFMTDVPVRGGLPSKFIKGSPNYQRTSVQSLRDHAREVKKDPKGFGKEVLRALTGVEHRPSTLLRQDPFGRRKLLAGP